MSPETKQKVLLNIDLENSIRKMTADDARIEYIADKYPSEYSNEDEYIDFQIEIAELTY